MWKAVVDAVVRNALIWSALVWERSASREDGVAVRTETFRSCIAPRPDPNGGAR